MKGLAVCFLVAFAAVVYADNEVAVEENKCPPEQDGDWSIEMLLRHEDCNKFYKCTHGVPVVYECYGNLFFNLATWECDWQENVDCTDRNIPEVETTTLLPPPTIPSISPTTEAELTTADPTTAEPITTTTEPTTTTTEPTTTTTEPTTTTTEPTTTTTEPTTTTTEPTTTTTEPTTTTTEPTTTTTEPTTTTTEPTTTTTTTTTTTEPTTTTTTTTTTTPAPEITTEGEPEIEFRENGCPVDPHIHWLLPHEVDCNKFYYCVWGQKVLRECPATTHFDPKIQVCVHIWQSTCSLSANKHFGFRQMLTHLL